MILVIDNYDSFVHNLARYLRQLGCETKVVRNDQIDTHRIDSLDPEAIVLSPGPCTPDEAGCCLNVVRTLGQRIPILGICLGHQAIVQGLGGKIVQASEPLHGRQSDVIHDGSGIFENVPSPFAAGRYHSLIADRTTLPDELLATARTNEGIVMAVQHRELPIVGLQFHPESILTECGYLLLGNFLRLANIAAANLQRLPRRGDPKIATTAGTRVLSHRLSQEDAL